MQNVIVIYNCYLDYILHHTLISIVWILAIVLFSFHIHWIYVLENWAIYLNHYVIYNEKSDSSMPSTDNSVQLSNFFVNNDILINFLFNLITFYTPLFLLFYSIWFILLLSSSYFPFLSVLVLLFNNCCLPSPVFYFPSIMPLLTTL